VEEASGAIHGWGPREGEAEAAARLGSSSRGLAMRLFSPKYYALCAGGGMLAAATNHLAITPLDVLKVNMQVRVRFVARLVDWELGVPLLDRVDRVQFFADYSL
jgi:hypothetical protein